MRRLVIVMLVGALVVDAAYRSTWFTHRDRIASEDSQAYDDFENAFPLADLWFGIACLLAMVTLVRRGSSAAFEAVIVAVTWAFAITVLRCAWSRRGELLAGDPGLLQDSEGRPPAP